MAKKKVAPSAEAKSKSAQNTTKVVSINDIPKLKATPSKPVHVVVNFKEVEFFLDLLFKRYKETEFTTANLEEVQKTKAAMVALRVNAEKFDKDIKADFYNNPKKVFSAGMAPIYAKIASIESKCDEVIAEEDQKRIDGINKAIDGYIKDFIDFYELLEDFRGFERKKQFYNKSQKETDTINDLQAQAVEFSRLQKAFTSSERLIRKACSEESLLNVDLYLQKLTDGEDVATILEEIDAEISRLNEALIEKEENEQEACGADNEDVVDEDEEYIEDDVYEEDNEDVVDEDEEYESIGTSADALNFESDLPERTKTITIEITYPIDVGDELTKLFGKLWDYGIKSKVLEV